MNPVLESLFKHKSIRRYKNQPVEDEKIQLIIKAAQAAPTWCNGEQVSIIVVKDQALKDKLKDYCGGQTYVATCGVFLVFCADFYRVSLAFEKAGKTKEDFEKYVTNIDTLIIGSHDVGIAIQNATVAAESLGLGTVDIGGVRINPLDVTRELKLPKYQDSGRNRGYCHIYYDSKKSAIKAIQLNNYTIGKRYITVEMAKIRI